ncbi:hypothetical protein [Nodularia sphaerocarpa]|uniref:hypothetical protein n=1 Tax=Nodularia sphaerocarpa TaxID=137816 RepID=UPI001EFB76B8|nr:hypothetical protein [Nodularia sphaerocarpa]MDB9372969.1 hypothetical protein [Nodularia sphaerocarpa CS-585]MDB9378292.1 hypothetical protein [Nodularia sphaerocarpa CS-585A2]
MLAQFQSLYPQGSIITELVQIFQGKYIVRCSLQIENVTRATGMAGAETVEAAEDQARTRALMVLGISNSPSASVEFAPQATAPVQLNPALSNAKVKINEPNQASYSPVIDQDFGSSQWSAPNEREISLPPLSEQNLKTKSITIDTKGSDNGDTYSQDFNENIPATHNRHLEFDTPVENRETMPDNQPESQTSSGNFASNVTPFTPRSYNPPDNVSHQTGLGKRNKRSEPVDLSDVIAKTDVELQRLGWTPEQGREHLIQTYGKRGRTLLTEEELHSFLQHLESQPDPVAGF